MCTRTHKPIHTWACNTHDTLGSLDLPLPEFWWTPSSVILIIIQNNLLSAVLGAESVACMYFPVDCGVNRYSLTVGMLYFQEVEINDILLPMWSTITFAILIWNEVCVIYFSCKEHYLYMARKTVKLLNYYDHKLLLQYLALKLHFQIWWTENN